MPAIRKNWRRDAAFVLDAAVLTGFVALIGCVAPVRAAFGFSAVDSPSGGAGSTAGLAATVPRCAVAADHLPSEHCHQEVDPRRRRPSGAGVRSKTTEPVRLRIAAAVTTISTTVIPTASRGLLRPTMPMTDRSHEQGDAHADGERGLVVLAEGLDREFLQPFRGELDECLAERRQSGTPGC